MKIIVDSREQTPWSFDFYPDIEIVTKKLVTGDYTIEGYEHILTIDRKATVAEMSMNVGVDKKRFEEELQRMLDIKYSHIICQFSIKDILKFPEGSAIPVHLRKYVKISGKFILKMLYTYEEKYGLKVHFCNNRDEAEAKAVDIFEYTIKMVE